MRQGKGKKRGEASGRIFTVWDRKGEVFQWRVGLCGAGGREEWEEGGAAGRTGVREGGHRYPSIHPTHPIHLCMHPHFIHRSIDPSIHRSMHPSIGPSIHIGIRMQTCKLSRTSMCALKNFESLWGVHLLVQPCHQSLTSRSVCGKKMPTKFQKSISI